MRSDIEALSIEQRNIWISIFGLGNTPVGRRRKHSHTHTIRLNLPFRMYFRFTLWIFRRLDPSHQMIPTRSTTDNVPIVVLERWPPRSVNIEIDFRVQWKYLRRCALQNDINQRRSSN